MRVTLSADNKIASLTVHNNGATETSIQLETVAWTQEPSGDTYGPTEALLATPPIFTLAPGETQIVRVGLRRLPSAKHEVAFRLFLNEIPAPAREDFSGLRVALRLGVPVFFHPDMETAPDLRWHLERMDDGRLQLQAFNHGTSHAQFGSASLKLANGAPIPGSASGYVLPGYSRQWTIEPKAEVASGDRLELEAQVNGKHHSHTLQVE